MKKILYFITLSETGGAQKVVYQLVRNFYKDNQIVLACAPDGELIEWVEKLDKGIKIVPLSKLKRDISVADDMSVLFQIMRIIRDNQIDIVHCHSSKAGLIGRLAAWLTGVPVRVFTVHGWSAYGSKSGISKFFYDSLERLVASISTHIVCVSEADRQYALKYRLANEKKLSTVHNGISPEISEPYLRKELEIGPEKIVIGTAARLSRQKNPMLSIEVYSQLMLKNENLLFVWIGDGPLREECLKQIHEKNLEERFILLGNRHDARNLIGDFNTFSLLSEWESLP